jgi:hypothetical protein
MNVSLKLHFQQHYIYSTHMFLLDIILICLRCFLSYAQLLDKFGIYVSRNFQAWKFLRLGTLESGPIVFVSL